MNLIYLIKKNLTILFRSKITTAVLFLGPLLVILIAGLAFNNSLSYNIKVGIYAENTTPLGNQFVEDLGEEFEVIAFPSLDLCVESVKSRGYHACIEIPSDLELVEGKQNKLGFYFDNSRVNIVSAIKQNIFKSVESTSQNISQTLTSSLLESITFAEKEITANKEILTQEISRGDSVIGVSKQSESLLVQSNLAFNKDDLSLDEIKSQSDALEKGYSTLEDLVDKAIDDFDTTLDNIENLNISNSALDDELDDGDDLQADLRDALANATANKSDTNKLISLITAMTSKIETLESNLESARTNKNSATTNLQTISKEIDASRQQLVKTKDSLDLVLKSIKGQEVRDASSISQPVVIDEYEIVTGSKLNYLFPNLIILVIMFVTIMTAATQVINEKLNKASLRVSMTPISTFTNAFATFMTILFIASIQILLILLLTQFFFKIDIFANWFPAITILLFATIFFTLLGIVIGYIFNTEHTVMLSAISVSSFFFILSDLILPLESMPAQLIEIMNFTPFILATNLLRKVVFFNISLDSLTIEFYSLVGLCAIVLLIIGVVSYIAALTKKIVAKHRAKRM